MPTIYRKTAKGHSEIETRVHRLAPRYRSLLIMVDGRRSDEELKRLMSQIGEAGLKALSDGGFIEAISVTDTDPRPYPSVLLSASAPGLASPSAASSRAPPIAAAPAAPWPAPAQAFGGREPPTLPLPPPASPTTQATTQAITQAIPLDDQPLAPWLVHRREEAARTLIDLCGPVAEGLAIRLERARSNEELAQLLDLAIQLVANARGRQKAVDYGTRFKGG